MFQSEGKSREEALEAGILAKPKRGAGSAKSVVKSYAELCLEVFGDEYRRIAMIMDPEKFAQCLLNHKPKKKKRR